jgi:hypothetical protein
MFESGIRRPPAPGTPIRSPARRGPPSLRERPQFVAFAPAVPVALRLDPEPQARISSARSWRCKVDLPACRLVWIGDVVRSPGQRLGWHVDVVVTPVIKLRRCCGAGDPHGADQRAWLAQRGPGAQGPHSRGAATGKHRPGPRAAVLGQRVDHRAVLWAGPRRRS